MSEYRHSLTKFADTGLQLRLPVDLVPSTQYSRLTNAVPRIEGEIRTRDGMTIISRLYQIAAVSVLSRVNTTVNVASIATTIYPNGYNVGDQVTITVTGSSPTGVGLGYGQGLYGGGYYGGGIGIALGTYVVTITTLIDDYNFTFTPTIPAAFNLTEVGIPVFAQAVDSSNTTSLLDPSTDTLFRLNQALPHILGDRLAAASGRLYRAPLPLGDTFTELVHPTVAGEPPYVSNGFSGRPLSIISFRFTLDTASWAIIADQGVMYKFRDDADGNPLFFFLGNPPPVIPATATAGAAGLLDSTGGALYDWRYTYFDGYVGTEGNPSPEGDAATVATTQATSFTTPDPQYAATSHAFTGVTNSTGSGLAHQLGGLINHYVSCRWQGFSNPVTTPYSIDIAVTWSATIIKKNAATVQAQLNYSVNGGTTFTRFATVIDISSGVTISTASLPLGTDLTQVVIQSYAFCNAGPGTSQNSVTVEIADILISTSNVPVSAAIACVNQEADVDVMLPRENDGRLTAFRLYRRGGSLPDAWRLVGTFNFSGLPSAPIANLAGAGANDGSFTGTTVAWISPANVTSTTLFATVALTAVGSKVMSQWLDATNFGFTMVSGQPVNGIEVTVTAKGSSSTLAILVVTLLKAGVPIGTWSGALNDTGTPPGSVKSTDGSTMPTTATVFTFGSPSDTWGTVWDYNDINAANFGVRLLMYDHQGIAVTFSVDNVNVSISTDIVQIIDNVSDTQLSTQPILELDNDQPVTSVSTTNQPLNFIWGPTGIDARVLGVGDPNRPECVYFSKPGNADAWPPENFVEVSDPGTPMVAGCIYNTRNYGFSREGIYELVEGLGTGSTFTPFKTPSAHGLYSPWGLALGPEMFFIAKDGIYASSGGQEASIVENDIKPLFPTYDSPGTSVEGYEAVDYSDPDTMRLVYHNDELYFIYLGLDSGNQQLVIYDLLKKRWRAADYNSEITTLYTEPATVSSLLGGTLAGEFTQSGGNSDPDSDIFVTVQTGAQDQGMPLNRKQYGNVIFDLDPGGADLAHPITIVPRINGEVANEAAITVTGVGRQQVPLDLSDYFAFNTEFLITWEKFNVGPDHPEIPSGWSDPVLYQFDTLWFPEPVGVKHWESQPSSLQMLGFGHIRDMYVAIRSTADVTMTMTFDTGTGEVSQTYTVPSTAGERRKVYIPLNSNKGLLYRFALDSDQEFRLYAEDIEVRTKGWLTVLGYTIAKPFGLEAA